MPYKYTDNSTVLQTPLYPGQALKALQLAISQVCLVFRTYNNLLPLCYEKVINFSTFHSLGFVGGEGEFCAWIYKHYVLYNIICQNYKE